MCVFIFKPYPFTVNYNLFGVDMFDKFCMGKYLAS